MNKKNKINILAVETSCDETAAAVLSMDEKNIKTLSSVVKSQIKIHKAFGGVFPEVAARAHIKNIRPVVAKALSTAHCALSTIDYFAVTVGPGLNPSLLIGVEFVKGLSFATNKPIIPVNHLAGHLYSPLNKFKVQSSKFKDIFPIVSLIVSGGHTILVLMKDLKNYKVLGQTVDDAAGEAFDKIARLLGLSYPGGPELSKLAHKGKSTIDFPRPMLNKKNYNFSFSGLKTAVLYFIRDLNVKRLALRAKRNIAASAQEAIVDVLVKKTIRATKEFKAKSVSISGGVSANSLLRKRLKTESGKLEANFFVPQKNLCTDNAQMIGIAAAIKLSQNFKPVSYKKIDANPNLKL